MDFTIPSGLPENPYLLFSATVRVPLAHLLPKVHTYLVLPGNIGWDGISEGAKLTFKIGNTLIPIRFKGVAHVDKQRFLTTKELAQFLAGQLKSWCALQSIEIVSSLTKISVEWSYTGKKYELILWEEKK